VFVRGYIEIVVYESEERHMVAYRLEKFLYATAIGVWGKRLTGT
jgi:hypothetical protein